MSSNAWIHLHIVFSTKGRLPTIDAAWRPNLHAYLRSVLHAMAIHPLAVGGVDDHVHLLIAVKPTHFLPEVMRDLKAHSSHWVREAVGFHEFAWQEGYGVFSVGCHGDATICRYIEAQEAHHRSRSFEAELRAMVAAHGEGPGEAVSPDGQTYAALSTRPG